MKWVYYNVIVILCLFVSCRRSLCDAQTLLRNPIITGFNPDPSICRVGDDYYVVNSSFCYFPGVPIYHSRDLVHWSQIGNVLDRESQLPLNGASSWLGIYAPTIRYNDGTYYMITTNVGNGGNFMVTATDPRGPWSEPIWLKQEGIDPSLYFEDGHCYMVSNPDNNITLCEIDAKTGNQLTDSKTIWRGTGGRYPEGPHIYKKDGYYYLLISEGGTELAHKLTIARSKNIAGPYDGCPHNPILTNCCMAGQTSQIQGTGHGDFVQATDGSWWMVFLAYRNFGGSYHHLGRETCLVPVEWAEGEWPVANGGNPVDTLMTVNHLLPEVVAGQNANQAEWLYLQNPIAQNYETLPDGTLHLQGGNSLSSNDHPTFVGRRQTSEVLDVKANVRIEAGGNREARAGLTIFQINDGHIDVVVSKAGVHVDCTVKSLKTTLGFRSIRGTEKIRLRITSDGERYRFYSSLGVNEDFVEMASLECSLVSTEVVGGFTGVVVGAFAEGCEAWIKFTD